MKTTVWTTSPSTRCTLVLPTARTQERTPLYPAALKGWGNTVSYHERLKPSYYILQKLWQ